MSHFVSHLCCLGCVYVKRRVSLRWPSCCPIGGADAVFCLLSSNSGGELRTGRGRYGTAPGMGENRATRVIDGGAEKPVKNFGGFSVVPSRSVWKVEFLLPRWLMACC